MMYRQKIKVPSRHQKLNSRPNMITFKSDSKQRTPQPLHQEGNHWSCGKAMEQTNKKFDELERGCDVINEMWKVDPDYMASAFAEAAGWTSRKEHTKALRNGNQATIARNEQATKTTVDTNGVMKLHTNRDMNRSMFMCLGRGGCVVIEQ